MQTAGKGEVFAPMGIGLRFQMKTIIIFILTDGPRGPDNAFCSQEQDQKKEGCTGATAHPSGRAVEKLLIPAGADADCICCPHR